MKNVVVFATGSRLHSVELRWVREVFTLGHITPVPGAPATISGAINFHGAIVALLNLGAAMGNAPDSRPHPSDSAIAVEVEGVLAAIPVASVEEVSTLREDGGGVLIDSRGRPAPLISPPEIVEAALRETERTRKASVDELFGEVR